MKRLALAILLTAGCGPGTPPRSPAEAAISRAARFLWEQQGADGGWHSSTYGLLRSGQSLTPFVLLPLLDVPNELYRTDPAARDRAIAFILDRIDKDGALGRADPDLEDYPNYATALAVRVLVKAGKDDRVPKMVEALRRQQFAEAGGWKPDHPAYGAWGMGGPPRTPPHAGHVDLSMTRHVLEALRAAGVGSEDPAIVRAKIFLDRCRNADGGFIFSTVVTDKNKAGPEGSGWRSYGTATADGVLALRATGHDASEGIAWLRKHHAADRVAGEWDGTREQWATGMIFYALAATAEAGVRKDVVDFLCRNQREDGRWANSSFIMKEDDPLIATSLALRALNPASTSRP